MTIIGNTITKNSALSGIGGGIYNYNSSTITGNIISDNLAGECGGIACTYGAPIITSNTISNNSSDWGYGGSLWLDCSATIKYNTITDTTASAIYIYQDNNNVLIDSNNLYATAYVVYNNCVNNVDARYNYWGTTDSATITNQKIWDYYDDFSKGKVYYEPFLTVGIEENHSNQLRPAKLEIYPNPVLDNAIIKYSLNEKADVLLNLYDISGRVVKTIYKGTQEKGYYTARMSNNGLAKGIYFLELSTGALKVTKKLTILK